MEAPQPLTALEAAHNVLVAICHYGDEARVRFIWLGLSQGDPYSNQIREMVDTELPLWKLLDRLPPYIAFPPKE